MNGVHSYDLIIWFFHLVLIWRPNSYCASKADLSKKSSSRASHTLVTPSRCCGLYGQALDVSYADVLSRSLSPAFTLLCFLGTSQKISTWPITIQFFITADMGVLLLESCGDIPKLCGIYNWCSTFNKWTPPCPPWNGYCIERMWFSQSQRKLIYGLGSAIISIW